MLETQQSLDRSAANAETIVPSAGGQIPYKDQADRLFNPNGDRLGDAHKQKIIPFLGAGVSISERTFKSAPVAEDSYPDQQTLDEIIKSITLPGRPGFQLTDHAAVFMKMALLMAYHLQAVQAQLRNEIEGDLQSQLSSESQLYPPSAGELAQLFSDLSQYSSFGPIVKGVRKTLPDKLLGATEAEQVRMFKYLTKASGIANPPDPLTSITSYYMNKESDREMLLDNLRLVISGKNKPTRTHRLLALAAKYHLERKLDPETKREDYLIITTNYDSLMEQALEDLDVPYAALITENKEHKVIVRFSSKMKEGQALEERYSGKEVPKSFALEEPQKMVLLLKLHGDVNPQLNSNKDGVIISDDDYVSYVTQMNTSDGVIPLSLIAQMQNKPFLFLGYSLNDWNVRSIFETFKKKRSQSPTGRDFAVMWSVRDFERVFFDKNNVRIFETSLNAFTAGLLPFVPQELRAGI
jgi:SIR2-like domain